MPLLASVNAPHQGQGSFAINQADGQQAKAKTDLGRVDHQSQRLAGKRPQDLVCYRSIPFPYHHSRIVEQAPHPVDQTEILSGQRKLADDMGQVNTGAQVQPNHQPGQIALAGDPFLGKPLAELRQEFMIQTKVVHSCLPDTGLFGDKYCIQGTGQPSFVC